MFYVYVLRSQRDGTYYVGNAQNVVVRLQQHNAKRCRSTKNRVPWNVVYKEQFNSRSEAVKRERFLKSGIGRKELKLLVSL